MPRGLILGLLIFIIYINDLCGVLNMLTLYLFCVQVIQAYMLQIEI